MSRKTKIWLIIIAIPLLLVFGTAIALKLYFTSARLKALVVPRVEEATRRKIGIDDASLSLFPTLGVTIEGLTVSAPQKIRFDKQEFLALDELVLDVNIFALIKQRLEINEIILRHPRLYLEVNKDGVANYSQPAEPKTGERRIPKGESGAQPTGKAPAAPKEQGGSAGLLLSDFQIVDGDIEYVDMIADRRILVEDYDQTTRASVGDGGNDIFLESQSSIGSLNYGSTKSFLVSNLPVKTYQRLTYKGNEEVLSIDSVSVGIHEIALLLKGTITNVQAKPVVNLTLSSTRSDLAQLLSLVPREYLETTRGISSSGKFQFAMHISGEVGDFAQPGIKGEFAISDGSIRYTGFPKGITGINLSGGFEKPPVRPETGPAASRSKSSQPGRFGIERLSANLGTSAVTGKFGVVNFDDPLLSAAFTGELNLAEVKEFYPLEQGTELTGSLKGHFAISGKTKVSSSIKADGTLEFRRVSVKTAGSAKPLRDLNGVITLKNQLIETKQLSMNLGESDMTLAFAMRNYLALVMQDAAAAGKPMMTASLTSKHLRTVDLMSEKTETSTGSRVEVPPGKQAPRAGSGEVRRKAGHQRGQDQSALLPNMDADADVTIGKLETEKFEFTDARGAVKIRDGVITLQNFSVNAFEGSVVTKGMLDVRRTDKRPFDLDLDIRTVQAHALLPKFTSVGNNLFGKFSMKGTLKGDLNDTLGLNTKTLNGEGKVQITDGKYAGSPMTLKLADYTGIGELREMAFKNWSNAFTITEGRIHIKDLKVLAANTDLAVNGSQGFDGSLDYKMRVRLPESASGRLKMGGFGGELTDFMKDKEGRVNLNFNVTGTASNPVYALDTQEARQQAKQALEQKAREEGERLKEEAKKKVEEGLKKLFKR